jgi:prepilin-type N-terminal cleavage/methylation domain-containing protein
MISTRIRKRGVTHVRPGSLFERCSGFSVLEILVAVLVLSIAFFAASRVILLVLSRLNYVMELVRQEDQGARFVSSIVLATKTATGWGIYSNMEAYLNSPQANLAPTGNVLVCNSATQSGTVVSYVFVYDPAAKTLKRFENNMSTERMSLSYVSPTQLNSQIFNQDLGLVQGHWQINVRGQLLRFAAYGTPLHMR